MSIILLAIETSCDETGIALIEKRENRLTVLAEGLSSQIDIHRATGGVVPERAAREHVAALPILITEVFQKANRSLGAVDAIAVTIGPGLMPALSTGVMAARTLALAWKKPIVPVHHIEGHILSALVQGEGENWRVATVTSDAQVFPALALIVSGGHTLFVHMKDHVQYKVIGTTRDDAAGEVFDKVARMLELPYPGGPHISKLAEQGNPTTFTFPRPMSNSGDLDVSFSGLKTAVLYTLRDIDPGHREKAFPDIAAGFQQAVVDVLVQKTKKALEGDSYKTILLSGGVAANQVLRYALQRMADDTKVPLRVAPLALCGDNGVMIGQAGALAYEAGRQKAWHEIDAIARVSIEDFSI